jgi:hypothetical protein
MRETYKKIEAQENIIRYIALVFLGAGINFTMGYALINSGLTALLQSPIQSLSSTLPQTASILAISYFIIGIVYSVVASLASRPKSIISPLYTQITTAAFIPILITFLLATLTLNPAPDLITGSAFALTVFLFALMLFFAAGMGQTLVVKYLVGLNGTKEDTSSFGLLINGKLRNVVEVLKDADVRETLNLRERDDKKIGNHSFVFRTPPDARKQFFIAVTEDSVDKTKTQLATVSYRQTFYGIIKLSNLVIEQEKRTIESVLSRAGFAFNDSKIDSSAQTLAYNRGLSITESKLLELRSLPPYSKAILIGLVTMIVIMTIAWKLTPYITLEMYETFLVLAIFSVLFDLLPLLRTRRTKLDLE